MDKIKAGIYGVIAGDVLGVPVEFMRREALDENPVIGPCEHGSHNQPLGAWSDDSSQTLALADALAKPFSLRTITENLLAWQMEKKWTSHGYVFDIGQRTLIAFYDLRRIIESEDYEELEYLHFDANENTNGNGSLMRTLPLYFHLKDKGIEENFPIVWQVSALTHPHIRAALACLIYLVMIDELLVKKDLVEAYTGMQMRIKNFFIESNVDESEIAHFARIISSDIRQLPRHNIVSSGYVVATLEASLWSLLTTSSYSEAILRAINLGGDTDTAGAVTGGLAGMCYGLDSIPYDWLSIIPKHEEIDLICTKLHNSNTDI